jgi:hypothetical protein
MIGTTSLQLEVDRGQTPDAARLRRIAVLPYDAFRLHERLLTALEGLFGVRFIASRDADPGTYDGALLLEASSTDARECARSGLRTLAFLAGQPRASRAVSEKVCFGRSAVLPRCFHGARLADESLHTICDLTQGPGDDVIATLGEDVLWLHHDRGGAPIDLVAVAPPVLAESAHLFTLFRDESWFSLLPLIQFTREISGWVPPSARACFMFDDPNLHWRSYGYVKYAELAEHARAHRYHASFATVPIDAWYTNQTAANLFRDNAEHLSLLVHGNDHARRELHATRSPLAVAAQALRRVERLERRAGVQVSRVMAAPHGACSEDTARAMLRTGFEAACISRASLMARNPEVEWPSWTGLAPAAFFGGGLPIIPRFNIRAEPETRVRFAMLLGQPVIPIGHHDDLRDGLLVMERLARLINSLGDVRWTNPTSIARTNYETSREGETLDLRLYSRRIEVQLPPGVTRLRVWTAWKSDGNGDDTTTVLPDDANVPKQVSRQGAVIPVPEGSRLTVAARPVQAVEPGSVPAERTRLRVVVRRQLCEGRDRLRPAVDRLLRRRSSSSA